MQKQKKNFDKILFLRISLTAILALCFLLIFFLGGGLIFLSGRMGNVKNFANLPFEVHFIDVGQGDCAFIRFPDNSNMLIDTGTVGSGDDVVDYLQDLFRQEGINKIDTLLITHQDKDHVGGATFVLESFDVESIYRPKICSTYELQHFGNPFDYSLETSEFYNDFMQVAFEENCKRYYNSSEIEWSGEEYSVKFLSPKQDSYQQSNDYCAVVKITYKDRSFLFASDAESGGVEDEIMDFYSQDLKADVLKVAHHGSADSSSSRFLSLVDPKVAVISVGKNNIYRHPSQATLDRLNGQGCEILRTDLQGSIVLGVGQNSQLLQGGQSNQPQVNLSLTVIIFAFGVCIIWGVKFNGHNAK